MTRIDVAGKGEALPADRSAEIVDGRRDRGDRCGRHVGGRRSAPAGVAARARMATRIDWLRLTAVGAGVNRKLFAWTPRRASSAARRGSATAGVKVPALQRGGGPSLLGRLAGRGEGGREHQRQRDERCASCCTDTTDLHNHVYATPVSQRDVVRPCRSNQQSAGGPTRIVPLCCIFSTTRSERGTQPSASRMVPSWPRDDLPPA